MRLVSFNEATHDVSIETFKTDSVRHSLFLHTRMWQYNDPISPRANLATFEDGEGTLILDIGLMAPRAWLDAETARLGEASKIVCMPSPEGYEYVAMTSDDEIVQIICRIYNTEHKFDRIERAVLITRDHEKFADSWRGFADDVSAGKALAHEPEVRLDDSIYTAFELAFEIDRRYESSEQLPARILQTGEGNMHDMRSNWAHTVSIVQAVDHPSEVENIGTLVFKHPLGNVFGIPGLPTPEQVEASQYAAPLKKAPRSRRKRRRRLEAGSRRGGRIRRKKRRS